MPPGLPRLPQNQEEETAVVADVVLLRRTGSGPVDDRDNELQEQPGPPWPVELAALEVTRVAELLLELESDTEVRAVPLASVNCRCGQDGRGREESAWACT